MTDTGRPPQKVLLVEPSASGHHMALYLRHVVRGLAKKGFEIALLTTREATADPAYQLVAAELPDSAKIYYFQSVGGAGRTNPIRLFFKQLINWLRLRQAVRKLSAADRPDIIYVPTVDWIAKAIEVMGSPFGDVPFVALYMSPKHHRFATGIGPRSRSDALYDRLFRRSLCISSLRKLLVIDDVFYEFAKSRYGVLSAKIGFAPDFGVVEGRATLDGARKKLGIPNSKKIVLVYGSLTSRKGIKELLDALSSTESPEDVAVLLAGRPSQAIKEYLCGQVPSLLKKQGKLYTQLKFHDQEEESVVFGAADVVWIAYTDGFYGSSGVLHQAACCGLPVIAADQGLAATLTTKFSLGVTMNPREIVCVVGALRMLSNKHLSQCSPNQRLMEFKLNYSSASHVRSVVEALSEAGNPPGN